MQSSSNPNSASPSRPQKRFLKKGLLTFAACMVLADEVFAQSTTSPWTQAVQALQTAFTGPIATGLALVSIVVGGLMFAFGEGAAKRTLPGVIFGVGMAVGAVELHVLAIPICTRFPRMQRDSAPPCLTPKSCWTFCPYDPSRTYRSPH